jgi:hypothetical protein
MITNAERILAAGLAAAALIACLFFLILKGATHNAAVAEWPPPAHSAWRPRDRTFGSSFPLTFAGRTTCSVRWRATARGSTESLTPAIELSGAAVLGRSRPMHF